MISYPILFFCFCFVLVCIVPEFNISSDAAFEVTDEDMQKTFVKKHHSFSSHCKKLLGRKKSDSLSKSFDEEVRNIP